MLFTLAGTVILFLIFAGVSTLSVLGRLAYVPETGWQQPAISSINDSSGGCAYDRKTTSGFPVAYNRQADEPYSCLKAMNSLARAVNYALCFAIAAILSVSIVNVMRKSSII
jgi:hypothetical protein